MEAEIIHAVGVCFDVRESQQYHPRRRRAGCRHIIHAAGVRGAVKSSQPEAGGGAGFRLALESQRPVWMKRRILSRRYWKYSGLTRSSSTSSMTAEK
jgi:hypothetical protein